MSSSLRGASQKSFTAQAWDGLIGFFIKTLMPLIPIAGVFWLISFLMNSEITGTYRGMVDPDELTKSPLRGAMMLDLEENNDQLSGFVVFKQDLRYKVDTGRMIDENKLQMKLSQQSITNDGEKRELTFDATKDQNVLRGVIHDGVHNVPVRLNRSSTSSFFGKRWFVKTLNYFGAGIK